MALRVKKIGGGWEPSQMKVTAVRIAIPMAMAKITKEVADAYVKVLQEHIDRQDLPLMPLADGTVVRKGSEAWYIETGEFRDKLRSRKLRSLKTKAKYLAGALASVRHRGSGLNMMELANILNNGGKFIPPRDLFGITLEEFYPRKAAKAIAKSVWSIF